MRRAAALLGACLASMATAQEGEMTFTWEVSDTGNGNGVITPGESAMLSLWAAMDPERIGFASAMYDIIGGTGWETGGVVEYDNLLDEITDDGHLESNGDITEIESFQLPPAFNDHFIYESPVEIYRVVWTPVDYEDRTVSVYEFHVWCYVYVDEFGNAVEYTCVPGEVTFPIVDCRSTDLTGDGLVDTRDVIVFLRLWSASDPQADWDGNGTIDTQDFTAYLNDWAAGC